MFDEKKLEELSNSIKEEDSSADNSKKARK